MRFIYESSVAEKYEREAKKYWDIFYKRHQDRVIPILYLLISLLIQMLFTCFFNFYHYK